MKKCIKVVVYGQLAGSGYCSFVKKAAQEAGVEGSIQHQVDGTLLVYACGDVDALDDVIDALYDGPEGVSVDRVSIETAASKRDFRGVFRVIE